MGEKKNEEGKPFMESVFGKILTGIIVAIIGAVMYIGWVNSGSHDGNFFGMAFRFPLESKDHYCWRKTTNHVIVVTTDQSAYKQCMAEE